MRQITISDVLKNIAEQYNAAESLLSAMRDVDSDIRIKKNSILEGLNSIKAALMGNSSSDLIIMKVLEISRLSEQKGRMMERRIDMENDMIKIRDSVLSSIDDMQELFNHAFSSLPR